MSNDVCFLITVLYNDTLLQCALKIDRDKLTGDIAEYPMEPENRQVLHSLLPLHVKNCGPIVDITTIFEIKDITSP